MTRLYQTFLRRAPDSSFNSYVTQASAPDGRSAVLEQFLAMSAYRERSAALYREINWLVADHLGTPRFIVERTGSLAGLKRSDYLPFGESAHALGGRTAGQGYGGDSVRQGFTGYEEDAETGLDYAQARYFASIQGRFISVDPALISGHTTNPKTWNRYAYALNNPLRFADPTGLFSQDPKDRLISSSPTPPPNPCTSGPGCLPWVGEWNISPIASGAETIATTPAATATMGTSIALRPLLAAAGTGATGTLGAAIGVGIIDGAVAAVAVENAPPGTLRQAPYPCPVGSMGLSCQASLIQMANTGEQAINAQAIVDADRLQEITSGGTITLYHYTDKVIPPGEGLLPANSATTISGMDSFRASQSCGIPPPLYEHTVTFQPSAAFPVHYMGLTGASRRYFGGSPDFYFPNGTPPGSLSIPRPVLQTHRP